MQVVSYVLVHRTAQQWLEKAVLLKLKIMAINWHFMASSCITIRDRSVANCTYVCMYMYVLKEQDRRPCSGLMWLSIRSSGGLL